ncbi:MAG: DUF4214 domain-containing protein [Hyphomicrobiaceae bacterium]|nr:DUF4214 domain-containing protein [Hyphomicrobiaceae bacterium]
MLGKRFLFSIISMLRWRLWIAVLLFFVTAAHSVRAADLLWGINGHPFTAYPGVSLQRQLDLVKDLGMRSYRVNVSSIDSIRGLSDLAALGRERGIDILPVLTPGLDLKRDSSDALYAKSFNFAVTLVSALKHVIKTWELGNELENFAILQPCEAQDDGKQYPCSNGPASGVGILDYHGERWKKVSAVLKGLSDGVVSIDPKLKKAIGTAGWGHVGAFQRMEQDGIKWDISVWHAYQQDPEWILERIANFKRPIWITEFNHAYGSRDGRDAQAQGIKSLIEKFRQWQGRFNIEAAFVYELLDEPYWAPDFEAVMGLVAQVKSDSGSGWTDSDKKPAYTAVKIALAAGNTIVQRSCGLESFKSQDAMHMDQVGYAYCLLLGRHPDGQGATDWGRQITEGMPIQAFMLALVDSDEFSNRYLQSTVSHKDFVNAAFAMLLGRKPDGAGLQSYLTELGRGSMRRRDVIDGIISSSEFKAQHTPLFSGIKRASGNDRILMQQ